MGPEEGQKSDLTFFLFLLFHKTELIANFGLLLFTVRLLSFFSFRFVLSSLSFSLSLSPSLFLSLPGYSCLSPHLNIYYISLSALFFLLNFCPPRFNFQQQAAHFQSVGGVRERGILDSIQNGNHTYHREIFIYFSSF